MTPIVTDEEPGCIIDIAMRLRVGQSGVRIPSRAKDFPLLQTGCGAQWVPGFFPREKAAGV
jgi:hypothetical protein